jgi:hypothetical protein
VDFLHRRYYLSLQDFSYQSFCRGGRGGGYKELDEEELEEVRRRRKEAEEVGHILLYFCISVMMTSIHV